MLLKHSINYINPWQVNIYFKGTLEWQISMMQILVKAYPWMDLMMKKLGVYITNRKLRLSQAKGNITGFCWSRESCRETISTWAMPKDEWIASLNSEFPIPGVKQANV